MKKPTPADLQKLADATVEERDHAILRLMLDLGLRRGEIAALDRADLQLGRRRLLVGGEALKLPNPTLVALRAWNKRRGRKAGPLFRNYDPCIGTGNKSDTMRLSPRSVGRVVTRASFNAGLRFRVSPNQVRRGILNSLLDAGRSVPEVLRFSRVGRLQTLRRLAPAARLRKSA
jgi:integrase